MSRPLLIEIGCEEIPARFLRGAAEDLSSRIGSILDQAGLEHAAGLAWGGPRRLAVRLEAVADRQPDREELVLGPPAKSAFGTDGRLMPAALGFAKKHGLEPSALERVDSDRGSYAGFRRTVKGLGLRELLTAAFPQAVQGMSFPKTMRWGEGRYRWARPVHWLLALHGDEVIPLELFGVQASGKSRGHRFLAPGPVEVSHADRYADALRQAFVVADPGERRRLIRVRLRDAAREAGGELVEDDDLLEEVADLVEWPAVVTGRFDEAFLDLPREILVTTLRHHQKSFSVRSGDRLLPAFLSVANTDQDRAGHIRRGNEWVVSGRLDDARFFWNEDRKRGLASRVSELGGIVFHKSVGSYLVKTGETRRIAEALCRRLGLGPTRVDIVCRAAELSKADLVTGLVGEFPELQGVVGGLLLESEGADRPLATAVYEHYCPSSPEDSIPRSEEGAVVSVADRLSTIAALIPVGEAPTGSKDPFGLRRAANGIFRIVEEKRWPVSLWDLFVLTGQHKAISAFLEERHGNYLREKGYSLNEIRAVERPHVGNEYQTWPMHDVVVRLGALRTVRGREDFEHLVDLTKRVDNIHTKNADEITRAAEIAGSLPGYRESEPAFLALDALVKDSAAVMQQAASTGNYGDVIDLISKFVVPVERFFDEVLVINPDDPAATWSRVDLLARAKSLLTSYFDIRELAGQADRRT